MAIDGPRSECLKAEWYDILHPNMALVTARVKPVHAARRREWNRGFTTKGMVYIPISNSLSINIISTSSLSRA
jgi:tryprostatin B 6-hydroxylase